MKNMKKLVAALLVLTMVLALTGSAMADCKIKAGDYVKFIKNAYAYDAAKASKKTDTIVRKGSWALARKVKGSYVLVQLTRGIHKSWTEDLGKLGNYEDGEGYRSWAYWFKSSTLDTIKKDEHKLIVVTFSNGGVGKSKAWRNEDGSIPYWKDTGDWVKDGGNRISADCMKHIKATSKVWMHYTPSLSQSYGKALKKDQKVTYRRIYSFDTRGILFYGIRYKGKCLWVSEMYTKPVK